MHSHVLLNRAKKYLQMEFFNNVKMGENSARSVQYLGSTGDRGLKFWYKKQTDKVPENHIPKKILKS